MKYCPICRKTFPGSQALFCPVDGSTLEMEVETEAGGPIGSTIDGKYRLESRLGVGGMGTVYRAHHLLLGRDVAVKILHPDMLKDSRAAERFRREAQAAARLEHPNAVTIYDFGIAPDGSAYLVMELLRGVSLRDVLDRGALLPLDRVVEIFSKVCSAIDRAHALGIIHRDLKPDNIMVDERDDGTTGVKVVDFGIAMLQDLNAQSNRLTGTGMVVGTANYMSPEQCRGAELDARSDIYSLGIVLFEMLTGRVPFEAAVPSAVIVAHVSDPPPAPRSLRPDLPVPVEQVVLKGLSKQPGDRPSSAGQFAKLLEKAVEATMNGADRTIVVTSNHPSPGGPTSPVQNVSTAHDPPYAAVPPQQPGTGSYQGGQPHGAGASGYGHGQSPVSYGHGSGGYGAAQNVPPTTPARIPTGGQPVAERRGLSPAALVIVGVLMVAIGIAAAAAVVGVMNYRSSNTNVADARTPMPTPTPEYGTTPTPTNTNANRSAGTPTPPVDLKPDIPPITPTDPPETSDPYGPQPLTETQQREVESFLSDWVSSSMAHDIDWHMSHYAPRVDYYKAGTVARARVRADRVRAYAKYDTLRVEIPVIYEATFDESSGRVHLVFDKQWRFDGPDGSSRGKVKQALDLQLIGRELKIVGERDLMVY